MPGEVTDFIGNLFLPFKKNVKFLFTNICAGLNQMIYIFLTRHCPRRKIEFFMLEKQKTNLYIFVIYNTYEQELLYMQESHFVPPRWVLLINLLS